jgi:hypothetical protein
MKTRPTFMCQQDGCGRRRSYERIGMYIVVYACGCGDPEYSVEAVSS